MFKAADEVKKAQSWEFMKWWMSTATQTEFRVLAAIDLWSRIRLVVRQSRSRRKTRRSIPTISRSFSNKSNGLSTCRAPRVNTCSNADLSDIWNQVTFDGTPIRVAIDDQVLKINREITKKMVEFGYLDAEGNVLVPYTIRDTAWVNAQIAAYHAAHGED
ncbi:MAG: hypothetical protein MZU79_02790 [Anaerotruncus sp.]|nr:hypothetical protein [Anaerotruncus sp.]